MNENIAPVVIFQSYAFLLLLNLAFVALFKVARSTYYIYDHIAKSVFYHHYKYILYIAAVRHEMYVSLRLINKNTLSKQISQMKKKLNSFFCKLIWQRERYILVKIYFINDISNIKHFICIKQINNSALFTPSSSVRCISSQEITKNLQLFSESPRCSAKDSQSLR